MNDDNSYQNFPVQDENSEVLIIDDEPQILSVLKDLLSIYGYIVYTAPDGAKGLEIFKKRQDRISLVILDVVMPYMDGLKVFQEIKKIKAAQRVLFISGFSDKEKIERIKQMGAVGFLSKPFRAAEILMHVKKFVNKASA
ncbi:MAG: response regulator [Calditrichia bacterium]